MDLSKNENNFWVGINSINVDPINDQIILQGGFDVGNGTIKIEVSKASSPESYQEVKEIVSKTSSKIIFKDENSWINNTVNIKLTATKSGKTKTVLKKNVFLNKGKNDFTEISDAYYPCVACDGLTTNGKTIYISDSENDSIISLPAEGIEYSEDSEELFTFDETTIEQYFELYSKQDSNSNYDLRFSDNLVYLNNKLYTMVSYGEMTDESYYIYSEDDDIYIDYTPATSYFSERKLFEIPVDDPYALQEIPLPASYDRTADFTLAGYNGELYVLGGYDYSKNNNLGEFTNSVYSLNSDDQTWHSCKSMPGAIAGGKALQSGNKLIYTLGYNEDTLYKGYNEPYTLPENYIFDGNTWKKSSTKLTSMRQIKVERGDNEYATIESSVGLSKNGITYIHTPVYNYGDTYTYNAETDKYKDTGCSYSGENEINAIVLDSDIYAFDSYDSLIYKAENAVESGLVNIKETKSKYGKISGAGKYVPGNIYTIKSVSKSGYYTTKLSVPGGSTTSNCRRGLKSSVLVSKDINVSAKYRKFKVVNKTSNITLKAGNKYKIKDKITPKAAIKQWKLTYKSSNTKYATVSSNGLVSAKKAGKGKKVTISIKLTGSNKVVDKFKLNIK